MVYIKLEENMDKFMDNKYAKVPKHLKKVIFSFRCKNGRFLVKKTNDIEYILLPKLNDKIFKRLKKLSEIKCWHNICVSNNLLGNDEFVNFANENVLRVMDGNWLLKNIVDKIMEYIVQVKKEQIETQEVCILCNKLDETIIEKIKEICEKVKVCNVLTCNIKQYQKLENELYQKKGIILNISNNYKRIGKKSSIVINFDFSGKEVEVCNFGKNAYIINVNKDVKITKKDLESRNIISYEIGMPKKYLEYKKILTDFNSSSLYESFIFKHTNYNNTKKELLEDNIKVLYLEDYNKKILKYENANLPKTLDKIVI